jgi:adenylate cyclase
MPLDGQNSMAPEVFRFENLTLDIEAAVLRTDDREIVLRPKTFEVLRCLVENAGRLVGKDELMRAVWPNVIVSDESLMQCVSELRQAIGDSRQTIIKTVPRRGYRFATPVSLLEAGRAAEAEARSVQALSGDARRTEAPLVDRPSVGVLPFINLSGDARQEYFSDGITEDIITELSRFSELVVIARNSTFQYKGKAD